MSPRKILPAASSFISLYLLFVVFIGKQVNGSPAGAPLEACNTMTPNHGVPPQTSPSPYVTIPTVVQT